MTYEDTVAMLVAVSDEQRRADLMVGMNYRFLLRPTARVCEDFASTDPEAPTV
jgi:hypothetical protein